MALGGHKGGPNIFQVTALTGTFQRPELNVGVALVATLAEI